jgi:seryl-tRNA synthetase
MQEIPERIKRLETRAEGLKADSDKIMLGLPNILHESVPDGNGEGGNKVVRTVGKPKALKFKARDHIEIGEMCDLFDIERAAKVSGARFYYLKNEAVQLEFAIIQYVLNHLAKKGFQLFVTPALIREEVMEGAGFLPAGRDDIYKIEGEKLYLVGTSEQALAGLHMDEILEKSKLPLRYCGFSSCFRTEAGAHGRDTKGIFRVHQFDKVEMFIFCKPEESWKEHELLLKTAEEIYQGLEIPYRIVNICTGEMGVVAAKKYDIEAWLPGQGAYREVVSCSNCTDYQARRLKIRCRQNPGDPTEIAHTLNSTASAVGRTIVAILENCQNEDGSVTIPKALKPYISIDKILPKKAVAGEGPKGK